MQPFCFDAVVQTFKTFPILIGMLYSVELRSHLFVRQYSTSKTFPIVIGMFYSVELRSHFVLMTVVQTFKTFPILIGMLYSVELRSQSPFGVANISRFYFQPTALAKKALKPSQQSPALIEQV